MDDKLERFLGNTVDASILPPHDYADLVRDKVMPIAPPGTGQVHFTDGTITQANESALSFALMKYAKDHKVSDMSSLCVLGFDNSYHGNSIGTLSCSDKMTNLQQVPTFDWPRAPFPEVKYPMATFEH